MPWKPRTYGDAMREAKAILRKHRYGWEDLREWIYLGDGWGIHIAWNNRGAKAYLHVISHGGRSDTLVPVTKRGDAIRVPSSWGQRRPRTNPGKGNAMARRDPLARVEEAYGKIIKVVVRDMAERGEPIKVRPLAKWFQRDCRKDTGITLRLQDIEYAIRLFRGMYAQ